jgi:hypothetical protein
VSIGRREIAAVALIVLLGTALRTHRAYGPPLWVDEAETTINALTILDHGMPVDHYLEMPIYENVLIQKSPDHPEYAFKDVSYSNKGLAIYHGWLPMYAIAAACRIGGILPADPPATLHVQHDESTFLRRSFVPRIPSILIGACTLILLFAFAREMLGPAAGWPVLIASAFLDRMVYFDSQARYYALTFFFSTLCGYAIWRTAHRRNARDYCLLAFAFIGLFHTHLLSFSILSATGVLMLPWIVRQLRDVTPLTAATAVVLLGTVPWLIFSGFLNSSIGIPRAWTQMVPAFALHYPTTKKVFLIPVLVGLAWLLAAEMLDNRLPARLTKPFTKRTTVFYFLTGWTAIAYAAFTFLIPAGSYFFPRMTLVVAVPGILLTVAVAIAASRIASPRRASIIATGVIVVLLAGSGRITIRGVEIAKEPPPIYDLIAVLRDIEFRPGTRVYASPNDHLPLTYYTGMPIQSVAPVRKTFLNEYPDDVVVIQTIGRNGPMVPEEEAIELGRRRGAAIAVENAGQWIDAMNIWDTAEALRPHVATVYPKGVNEPQFMQDLIQAQKLYTHRGLLRHQQQIPILQGQLMTSWSEWWTVFFYRFVDIEEHTGSNLNFGDRMRNGTATVLPHAWVIYESTPNGPPYVDIRKAYQRYDRAELLDYFKLD